MSDKPGFLDMKNEENRARWMWRWHLQGGSPFVAARPLRDLRNAENLKRWRTIEAKVRRLVKKPQKVISLAAVRINRARRQTACRA